MIPSFSFAGNPISYQWWNSNYVWNNPKDYLLFPSSSVWSPQLDSLSPIHTVKTQSHLHLMHLQLSWWTLLLKTIILYFRHITSLFSLHSTNSKLYPSFSLNCPKSSSFHQSILPCGCSILSCYLSSSWERMTPLRTDIFLAIRIRSFLDHFT